MKRPHSQRIERTLGAKLTEAFLSLLFPGPISCASCGSKLKPNDKYVCATCLAQIIPVSEPTCKRCGRPLSYPGFCRECSLRDRYFVRAWSAAIYRGALRKCLHRFKYDHGSYLAPFLAALIAKRLLQVDGLPTDPLIVPVPLDPKRLRDRGFNQAEILANEVAGLYGWQLGKKVLRRKRTTLPQAGLNAKERWANVSGAFVAEVGLVGKEILLIDDIYTTGATVEAASQALIEAGADAVYVATVAVASSHPQRRTT